MQQSNWTSSGQAQEWDGAAYQKSDDCAIFGTPSPDGCAPSAIVMQGFFTHHHDGDYAVRSWVSGPRTQMLLFLQEKAYGFDQPWALANADANVRPGEEGRVELPDRKYEGDAVPFTIIVATWGDEGGWTVHMQDKLYEYENNARDFATLPCEGAEDPFKH